MIGIKYSVFLISFLFLSQNVFAQAYGTALGLRVGDGLGVTLQQQVGLHTTVEGILQSSPNPNSGVKLSIMGENHHNILFKGFNFYLGGGLYSTWLQQDNNLKVQPTNPFGLVGIAGLEVKLGDIVISTDAKPSLRLVGSTGNTLEWYSGVSVRYVLAPTLFRNDGWKFWKKKR